MSARAGCDHARGGASAGEGHVGHAAIRPRGTIGRSLANADPAAEIPLVAVTLAATMHYREGTANAEVAAADFFVGPMTTACPQPPASPPCVFPSGAMRASAWAFTT
jgi:FAD binding domain in molybdopterin dehydrogenase